MPEAISRCLSCERRHSDRIIRNNFDDKIRRIAKKPVIRRTDPILRLN